MIFFKLIYFFVFAVVLLFQFYDQLIHFRFLISNNSPEFFILLNEPQLPLMLFVLELFMICLNLFYIFVHLHKLLLVVNQLFFTGYDLLVELFFSFSFYRTQLVQPLVYF